MSTLNVNNINEAGGVDAVITAGVLDSGSLPAGSIVDVQSVLKTDTFSTSVSAGGNVAVTDLSITHEVANASNKLLIMAFFGATASSYQRSNVGIAIHDGTSLIGVGDTAGSRSTVSAGGNTGVLGTNDEENVAMPHISFVHTPGAGSKTYTVRAVNIRSATQTLYVNRSESDADSSNSPRSISSLVLMEVAG